MRLQVCLVLIRRGAKAGVAYPLAGVGLSTRASHPGEHSYLPLKRQSYTYATQAFPFFTYVAQDSRTPASGALATSFPKLA